jgi:hypothetical protein
VCLCCSFIPINNFAVFLHTKKVNGVMNMTEKKGQNNIGQYQVPRLGPEQTPSEVHKMVTADQPAELKEREQQLDFEI